jgi:hypothetical protein
MHATKFALAIKVSKLANFDISSCTWVSVIYLFATKGRHMLSFATTSSAAAMARPNDQVCPDSVPCVSDRVGLDLTGGTMQLCQIGRTHPCSCDTLSPAPTTRSPLLPRPPAPPPPPRTPYPHTPPAPPPPYCDATGGRSFRQCARHMLDEMASGNDDLGEAGVRPETLRIHDWVPEGKYSYC